MSGVSLVLTTVGEGDANELVDALVHRRVVACVSTHTVASTYRWEGEIQRDVEVQLVCKTTSERAADVAEAIRDLHPYDLPEVLILEASASDAYASWVAVEVGPMP